MVEPGTGGGESNGPVSKRRAFDVAQSSVAGAVVLSVHGDVDALTAPRLTEALLGTQSGHPAAVIVDLTGVEFLASAGMTALVTAHQQLSPSVQFMVVADGPGTSRPLKLMGIDSLLALYPTLDEALSAIA
jgi:anti-sigma B factor antagonist